MSNDDKPYVKTITQVGHPKAPEAPKTRPVERAFADTLQNLEPPKVQHQEPNTTDDLVSSAPARAIAGHAQASGYVTLSGERVAESLARELIARGMAKAGFNIEADYAFSHGDLLVNLDGFDPTKRVGFQYISHADADVVTDVDTDVEEKLQELARTGVVHILVIHDHNATTSEKVVEQVEAFLAALPR
jgi:hypothetical protein